MSAYQALYRKWRPAAFSDIVGQKHVSDTLRSAVANGRIAHAYLFCGTRGTGKTSAAKIYARAVNCENPINGEPCNECTICRGILNGSVTDIYEMDAASNRGVENIREIKDEVIYAPVSCTYKVYIIDEVHMLTGEAFNALLKTLEEPPAHAIFILATTEPGKIPATVLSRCQRFDFHRISADDISYRILNITKAEGIDITPDAAELIAELGDGSMRDALSILDRCVAYGEKLDSVKVSEIIGVVSSEQLFKTADFISADDARGALCSVDEILKSGCEAKNVFEGLTDHFCNLLLCKSTGSSAEILEKTAQAAERYAEQAKKFSVERILYSIKILGDHLAQAKLLSNPKVALETAVVKLAVPAYCTNAEALLARIERLEAKVASLAAGKAEIPVRDKEETELPPWDMEDEAWVEPQPEKTQKENADNGSEWENWAEALNEIKKESKTLFGFLYISKAVKNGSRIEIEVGSKFTYDKIATPGGIEYLSKLFTAVEGTPLTAKVFIKGERKDESLGGFSINDLAAKKSILGDKMNII